MAYLDSIYFKDFDKLPHNVLSRVEGSDWQSMNAKFKMSMVGMHHHQADQ